MKLNRVLLLAVLSVLVASLGAASGCGGDDEEPTEPAPEQPADQQPDEPAEEPTAGDAAAGEQIFADNCAVCHGADGGGDTAPSLQRPELADNPERVADQVRNGGGGMPAFEGDLSEQQIADVTAYVTERIAPE